MEWIREYLIGVTAAAILCALVNRLMGKQGSGIAVRMVCGLLLTVSVIAPWTKARLDHLLDGKIQIDYEAEQLVQQGRVDADAQMRDIISRQTEAYILDKARGLGADISVTVTLSEDTLPVPKAVSISGNISPYGKNVLSQIISQDLGVGSEGQVWVS